MRGFRGELLDATSLYYIQDPLVLADSADSGSFTAYDGPNPDAAYTTSYPDAPVKDDSSLVYTYNQYDPTTLSVLEPALVKEPLLFPEEEAAEAGTAVMPTLTVDEATLVPAERELLPLPPGEAPPSTTTKDPHPIYTATGAEDFVAAEDFPAPSQKKIPWTALVIGAGAGALVMALFSR